MRSQIRCRSIRAAVGTPERGYIMAMKFGTQATQASASWEELLALWQELDRDSNFDHLWLLDHFVLGMGAAFGSAGPCLAGRTPLAPLPHPTFPLPVPQRTSKKASFPLCFGRVRRFCPRRRPPENKTSPKE